MAVVDPYQFAVDVTAYRAGDLAWLSEMDGLAVHGGEPYQRMGTRAIPLDTWLVADEHRDRELALRRKLVDDAYEEIVQYTPGSRAACDEAAAVVESWLAAHRLGTSPASAEHTDPFIRAGLQVQDDLCIMQRGDDGWRLSAAMLCFPSYWRLADKIGRVQEDVHGPVPHYAGDLSTKVNLFFDRLAPGRIIQRRNWGFSAHPLLFVPDLLAVHTPEEFHPDRLWLRSERQTLRRLPETGAILFTIRVQLAPGTALANHPDLAQRLAAVINQWSPELVASRGGGYVWTEAVSRWLATIH